ncbi:MAG: ParM/StbA family protein [Nostocaceae cyanobacterium]|nr:ParM/StbA family protein [Nostocaceae cyanobacterium]
MTLINTYGHTSPQGIQTRAFIAVDPGNRFIKWFDEQNQPRIIPSYVKNLENWEDASPDAHSYIVEFDGKRYAVGKLAQDLGGKPAFEIGKAELASILVLPALATADGVPQRVEKLLIPTPDTRNSEVIALLKRLETTRDFSINGINQICTVRTVKACNEGQSAFKLATSRNLWTFADKTNGVIDFGGGTAIARLFTSSGVLIRLADTLLPGTNALAQKVGAAMLPVLGYSPDLGTIMDAIANGSFVYGTTNTNFLPMFQTVQIAWIADIRNKLKIAWGNYLPNLGEVLMIGGTAPLMEPLEIATKSRFKIAPHPQLFSLYGLYMEA